MFYDQLPIDKKIFWRSTLHVRLKKSTIKKKIWRMKEKFMRCVLIKMYVSIQSKLIRKCMQFATSLNYYVRILSVNGSSEYVSPSYSLLLLRYRRYNSPRGVYMNKLNHQDLHNHHWCWTFCCHSHWTSLCQRTNSGQMKK